MNKTNSEQIKSCLVTMYLAGELPPKNYNELIPRKFDFSHCIAYIYLNIYQLQSEEGLTDMTDVLEDIIGWNGIPDIGSARAVCEEVIDWSQALKPRDVKPNAFALMALVKDSLNEAETTFLMEELHRIAAHNEDMLGYVMRYVRYLDCFFMSKRKVFQKGSFWSGAEDSAVLIVDPEQWTILHDLCVLMLFFNYLRSGEFDDNDRFNFQIAISNWRFDVGGKKFGYKYGNPDNALLLLDHVERQLFPPSNRDCPDLNRLAKSHANIVDIFDDGLIVEDTLKDILWDIYRATYASVPLSHIQKMRLKEYLIFWNQLLDLSELIQIVSYHYEDGIRIFKRIDQPLINLSAIGSFE